MINFSLVIHNHQPVGNFDHVIREAFEKSYRPFVDVLYSRPGFSFSIHFSGILYDWLEKNEPVYLEKLAEMTRRGQLEILGGGYYEPILSAIPKEDRKAQLEKMNGYIKKRFFFEPKGAWLAERVWEPDLPEVLSACGLSYTLLDDTHFMAAGMPEETLHGNFTTEYQGKIINILPIDHNLRYLMPFSAPEKTLEYLSGFKEGIFIMADDGEKFGLWPETGKLVYGEKWLERFLDLILGAGDKIKTARVCDYNAANRPAGPVYLPTASYHELSQWSLPAEFSGRLKKLWKHSSPETKLFLRGGYFKNFFTKYPESNLMHKRMTAVSEAANKLGDRQALDYLYQAQCNCGYWHGVFGGVYLPHIRMAVYENLLKSQKIIYEKTPGEEIRVLKKDLDCDGRDEILIENRKAVFNFSPAKGGSLFEWSLKDGAFNLGAVVSRRKEDYHDDPGSAGKRKNPQTGSFFYDWHSRASLIDHFLHPDTDLEKFSKPSYGEQGDFVNAEYLSELSEGNNKVLVTLKRDGWVWDGDERILVRVEKKIKIGMGTDWEINYSLTNMGHRDSYLFWCPELVFAFSGVGTAPYGEERGLTEKKFKDPLRGTVKIKLGSPADFWIFPLETVSNSEQGVEKTYQGSVAALPLRLNLKKGETFNFYAEVLHGND